MLIFFSFFAYDVDLVSSRTASIFFEGREGVVTAGRCSEHAYC